jgi:hypothetical protein
VEASELSPTGCRQGHVLTAAVLRVALALDESTLLDVVEVANKMASVDGEAVGELVLRERPEVGERREYSEVRQPKVVFRQRLDQQSVTHACRSAGEVRR